MGFTSFAAMLTILAATTPAADSPKLPEIRNRIGKFWLLMVPMSAEASTGYASNWKQRKAQGGLLNLQAEAVPTMRYKRGRFKVALPLSVSYRETFGFSLREVRLREGLELSGRPWKWLEGSLAVTLDHVLRPSWSDFYQPLLNSDGTPTQLGTTDRYSYNAWSLSGELTVPYDLGGSSLSGGFKRRVYSVDSAYDPVLSPTHLTPYDRDIYYASLSSMLDLGKGFSVRLKGRIQAIRDPLTYARDAGTGTTHSGPGGTPANPKQEFLRWDTGLRLSGWFPSLNTRLVLNLGFEQNLDTFQDYYTWSAPSGELSVRVRPVRLLSVEASYGLTWRTFTDQGYQQGPGHPALDEGELRQMVKQRFASRVTYAFWGKQIVPYLEMVWQSAQTNFPDYEPYVFPAESAYDIDFDYSWLTIMTGLEMRY